jgi:predicted secreted protein
MGVELGKNWRLKIGDGASPEVFTVVGGEGSLDWTRQSKEIDTSSKDTGQYATMAYGRQSVSFKISGKLTLPDTGLERVADIAQSATPEVNIQITKGSIVKFEGLVSVGNFSTSFPDDDACTYSADMKAAETPTVDDLGATS